MSYLCFYHDNDGDLRGWDQDEPDLGCQACRADKMRRVQVGRRLGIDLDDRPPFTLKEVEEYEKANPHVMQTHTMNWDEKDDWEGGTS